MTSAPRIACMNVKYSPNLGDGLLSECLEAALVMAGAAPQTRSIDLAARVAYGEGTAGRGTALAILDALPSKLRRLAVRAPLKVQSARKWAPHYARQLEGADAVVIGGGNLLSDLDLNFPTKLDLAMRAADVADLPVAIFGCGMGGTWSPAGLALIRRAFTRSNLRAVFLRDAASAERWNRLVAPSGAPQAQVVRDPGLLSARVHPAPARPKERRPVMGLGIMSHVAIRYHAEAGLTAEGLENWYVDLARRLTSAGYEVRAFTNGAPEDLQAAEALRPAFEAEGIAVQRPHDPAELSRIVADCDAIAAFRMHAVIAAYSHGVPSIALSWDDKLAAFMTSVGRGDWLHDAAALSPAQAAEMLGRAAAEGVDEQMRVRVLDEAQADVARMFAALCA